MMKSLICLSLILLPLISVVEGSSLGGWKPIKNLSDPNLESLAKYAVNEHNKQSKANLVFVKILQGEEQVVSGTKYNFIIVAKNGGGTTNNYEAILVEREWEHYKSLESFKPLLKGKGSRLGGWTPIKHLSDPNIEELAKYAINEHNKQSKVNLVFVKIVQGKEQVISGKKYELIIMAKNGGGGATNNYEAVLVEREWEHYRSLESFKPLLKGKGSRLGGWTPIKNLSDPKIEALAKYAINEHNKQSKANLMFVKIVQGKEQVISGKKYKLIITAKNGGGATNNYVAVLVEREWEHYRNLESFKPLLKGKGSRLGGWTPIKNLSNPKIEALAKYAINEHNKQSKANLVFVKIVQGKEQVIAGKKYELIIMAKNGGGATINYEAVLVEREWEHYRSLESFKPAPIIVGGWKPIKNLSDTKIEALAKYAINEHNKQSKVNLMFVKIVHGKEQVISGKKYELIITAKNGGGATNNYVAVLVEREWEHYRSLESFKPLLKGKGSRRGGWTPIKNLSDPKIEALAKYAINEHNKQSKANLVFVKIVQGKEQVIAGKKYDLIIMAKNGGGATINYEAVLVERKWEHYRSLESFKPAPIIVGGWKPIKNLSDPNLEALAKYAIDEHNKQSKANLVFVKIVQGKEQVVSGTKYDLIIAAKNGGGATKNYEAVLMEKVWKHYRSLESFKAV